MWELQPVCGSPSVTGGRTMIGVTHEMGFARDVASEVVFLHEGMIEERGAPAQVLAHPRSERLRRFLGGARAA